jgi:hypothetical protein
MSPSSPRQRDNIVTLDELDVEPPPAKYRRALSSAFSLTGRYPARGLEVVQVLGQGHRAPTTRGPGGVHVHVGGSSMFVRTLCQPQSVEDGGT